MVAHPSVSTRKARSRSPSKTGEHTLTEPCADAGVSFTVSPGETIEISIYNTTGKTACNTPTTDLPSTGAGPAIGDGLDEMLMLALTAIATALIGAGIGIRRRRPTSRLAA